MPGDADLAAVGSLLAEPARSRILLALGDGRALPATVLACEAGIAASTASEHLSKLVAGNLLATERHGRHRYYRLAGPEVGELLETVARLAPAAPVRSLRDDTKAAVLRRARTCYDHLAGVLGVEILRSLLVRGWLDGHDGTFRPGIDVLSSRGRDTLYRLTDHGAAELRALGVDLEVVGRSRRALAHCVDWSEQRHHLSGALGAALARRLFELSWLQRAERGRGVHVTELGAVGLHETFGLVVPQLGDTWR
ncbi:MAG TPA: metalloregulator ArsR/SmtB family transcription factor [Acidimicrobiales bacterium]|jgi:DNA-binding transcriptional ArsR family regulator|nr:metalloregulator ArsR/SmtB family transcription factor [Acidimicrobiales bacterium]